MLDVNAHRDQPPRAFSGTDPPADRPPLPVHGLKAGERLPADWKRATALFADGDYASAAEAFGSLARTDADPSRALVARAGALMHLGRFRPAADALEAALRLDPTDPVASMNLATAQYRLGLLPEALAGACAAAECFRAAGLNVSRPRHLQGLIYLESGRPERARLVLESALEADPTFVPAVLGLAQCCLARRDVPGAEGRLRAARRSADRAPRRLREVYRAAIDRFAAEMARTTKGYVRPRRRPRWGDRIRRYLVGLAAPGHPKAAAQAEPREERA